MMAYRLGRRNKSGKAIWPKATPQTKTTSAVARVPDLAPKTSTFIVAGAEYLPARKVDNAYFSALTGRPPEWFQRAAGIRERRRARPDENANTMAMSAVAQLLETDAGSLAGVDLVIGASYTPWDTLGTIAHAVQRRFGLHEARAIYLSTGCSSFLNAMELAAAYFESGRSCRALIVAAEHNSLYTRDEDEKSGHLWGDGAVAALLSSESPGTASLHVLDIFTRGLGDVGLGPDALHLLPRSQGLIMPSGRDVFQHACREMENSIRSMLARHRLSVDQIRLLVPHQANDRIISHLERSLGAQPEQMARTIDYLGNTGAASTAITLFRHQHMLEDGELAMLVTFGGGYSTGCALLRKA